MAQVFIGTLQPFGFDFAPYGWAFCDGRLLSIAQYQALYSLITTTYGGDGVVNFKLPDTRGRTLLGQGNSLGTTYTMGEAAGQEQATLTQSNLPAHNHLMNVSGNAATLHAPAGGGADLLAAANGSDPTSGDAVTVNIYAPSGGGAVASLGGVMPSGNNMPVTVMQPFLTNNYCIALAGIYPSRN